MGYRESGRSIRISLAAPTPACCGHLLSPSQKLRTYGYAKGSFFSACDHAQMRNVQEEGVLHDSRICSAHYHSTDSSCTAVHTVAMDHGVSAAGNCTLERACGGRSWTFDSCASHEATGGVGNGIGWRINGVVFSCRYKNNDDK